MAEGETSQKRIRDSIMQEYIQSYDDLNVHELMLKDRPRNLAYKRWFEENRDFVKDKCVMDIGAGTGILSLFAAEAGAMQVYAIEPSTAASLCEEIVQENGFNDRINVINCPVEEINKIGDGKVDIIVSEWMGFYLLHESMLESIIFARERFLKPGGILVPNAAVLYMSPIDMTQHFDDRAAEWSNIYGFDFSPIASQKNMREVSEPLVEIIKPDVIRSPAQEVKKIDLYSVKKDDLKEIRNALSFHIDTDSRIHGFAFWFSVRFDKIQPIDCAGDNSGIKKRKCDKQNKEINNDNIDIDKNNTDINHKYTECGNKGDKSSLDSIVLNTVPEDSIILGTGPEDAPTHWKQTIVFLPQTALVCEGIDLGCLVRLKQDSCNYRRYNISLELGEADDFEDDDEDDDAVETTCPVPCECGSDKCRLVASIVEMYKEEHKELEADADVMRDQAECLATMEISKQIENEGWDLDDSTSSKPPDKS